MFIEFIYFCILKCYSSEVFAHPQMCLSLAIWLILHIEEEMSKIRASGKQRWLLLAIVIHSLL